MGKGRSQVGSPSVGRRTGGMGITDEVGGRIVPRFFLSAENVSILSLSEGKAGTFLCEKRLKHLQIKAFRVNQQALFIGLRLADQPTVL